VAYTVLARKYRSQRFDEVLGQEPIAQTLKNAIRTGRVAHAYLFAGTRGVGKTTMARILAKALNCLSVPEPTTEPCCQCDSCTAIHAGEDIDVLEIDGASNRGIDNVRELRENAIYRPARSRYKIYIIDEVHMLTTEAFNALLKILEEPPAHVKFIFATTEPNKVIPTIQSRCQRFDFRAISAATIAGQLQAILKKEQIQYEDDLVLPLARMANGSMRDALSLLDRLISTGQQPLTVALLDQYLGRPDSDKLWRLLERIAASDAGGTLEMIDELISGGTSELQIVDALIEQMRDMMVVKSTGADSNLLFLSPQQRQRMSELSEKFDIAAIIYAIAALQRLRWSLKSSEMARPLLEAALLRLALSEHFINVDTLLDRLSGAGSAPVKKNLLADRPERPVGQSQTRASSTPTSAKGPLFSAGGSPLAHDEWGKILETIDQRLGPGTAGLLSVARPVRLAEDVLVVQFSASAQVQKTMCESNGRSEKIQQVLSEYLGRPIRVKFELASDSCDAASSGAGAKIGVPARRRNELINDPAVRTVLAGLDATITGIEEDPGP